MHRREHVAPILLSNIGQLLTLQGPDSRPRRGSQLQDLGIIEGGAVLCVAGKVASVGTTKDAMRDPWIKKHRKRIREMDCDGNVVLPGFVDSHTHPAFMAPRLIDFEKRIAGVTYEEIAAAGGGIRSSVKAVRRAGKRELSNHVLRALKEAASQGTTTLEAKSGYGLSLEAELKSLEAIRAAAQQWPGTVVPTFLGAHVVPSEFQGDPQRYVSLICKEMIPAVAKRKLASFVDVFCDRGAFTEDDTLKVFGAAHKNGLRVRAHVSQLTRTPLDRILNLDPVSLDHLDHVSDGDIAALARTHTIATLVPGANYFLGLREHPPARKLIDSGVAVALATDFNPGSSPTASIPFVLSLACTHMKMSPAEAIAAATINGAWALNLQNKKGSLETGKDADLAIFELTDYREIPYWIASSNCHSVIANGIVIS